MPDELYCYAKGTKDDDFQTIAAEVAAIQNGSWRPSVLDFVAISQRSNNMVPPGPDAAVDTFKDLLKLLGKPVRRVNFFTYGGYDLSAARNATIWLGTNVTPNSTLGFGMPVPTNDLDTSALNQSTLVALIELSGMQSQRALRGLLAGIRTQQVAITNRELWWYQVNDAADQPLMQAIASFLKIPIFIFSKPIQFVPDFSPSPPKIHVRGQVGLGFDRAEAMATPLIKDIHKLNGKATRLDP